ncbi:restriction endonuclease subunit S (plasmid) [Myroides odoratimimus]|uniref:restriction endonuclease subunit S n=1 Tax=Myroides odoratimimus TaxID=76832 RepID=UPI00103C2687|nr:restriction endonuclease subunit S [Myroides odoratimimus]QBK78186.1 restriction endonuclease subunit S [Myroides odoratimimus]WHT75242.1 restriction endonuclease subunit S [Myroides odoratimimus]WHU39827.1 restriction endonuclease subunit S [Myroides odoratimimus]
MENSLFKNSELGLIPFNWNEYSVEKLIELEYIHKPLDGNHGSIHPKGKDFIDCGIPFIMASDINNGKVNLKHCSFISEEQANSLQKGFSIEGDVLLTHKATLGRTAIVPKISTDFIMLTPQVTYYRIKNNDYLNNKYLKYYFDSPSFQGILENHGSSGSTRAYIGITAQRELPIIIPPLPEQKAIASVLSSLDDKIDLLHQQNQTLEALAETLYLNFIGEREFNSKLSNIFSLQNGYAFKSKSFKESGTIRVIKIKNISGDIVDITNSDFVDDESIKKLDTKFKINSGDILIAMTGAEVGKLGIVPETEQSLWLNQRVGLLKEKFEGAKYLAYLHLKSDFGQDYIENTATGSAQPNISGEGIENCEFPFYEETELREICNKLSPLYDKVIFNLGQIQTLTKLRDTLLPKLMSGEVRVQL